MNVACSHRVENLPILFVDFNQDFSSILVGTKSGYSLLSTAGDQISEAFSSSGDPACIVGRLFNRSLITLVTQNDMRKLAVCNYRKGVLICNYRYTLTILAVKINHKRLVVCVEDGIFIHNIYDMQMLHRVEETPPNRNGVLALSTNDENCYLAYPGSHRVGTVFIFDALNFQNITSIAAHDGLLAALSFNSRGNLLATASEKGTVIRVFSIPQGDKLMEFRRGLTRCVAICCINFCLKDKYLVTASHTETVHIFNLEPRNSGNASSDTPTSPTGGPTAFTPSSIGRRRTVSSGSSASQGSTGVEEQDTSSIPATVEQQVVGRRSPLSSDLGVGSSPRGSWSSGLVGWVGNTLKAYSSYLPYQVSEIFTQDRSFAYAHLPSYASAVASLAAGNVIASAAPTDLAGSPGSEVGSGQLAGTRKVAAIVYHQNQPRLIVAGLDGLVHTFAIDPINGGEATLLRTQRLLSPNMQPAVVPRPLATSVVGGSSNSYPGQSESPDKDKPYGPGNASYGTTHLTGSPQQPGVYVTSSSNTGCPRLMAGDGRGPITFASVVAAGSGTPHVHREEVEDTSDTAFRNYATAPNRELN